MARPGRRRADHGSGDTTDSALFERSLTEPEAFTELFERYGDEIYRYAARRLGADAADDVVSKTFLDAFTHRDRYDPATEDARPWLYGIASNIIGKHRRAEQRAYRAWARLGADPISESFTSRVDDKVVAQALGATLAAALAGMGHKNREVLLLVAWADLSYEEAAAALGVPIGTVRSRLHRARQAVHKALDNTDPRTITEGLTHG